MPWRLYMAHLAPSPRRTSRSTWRPALGEGPAPGPAGQDPVRPTPYTGGLSETPRQGYPDQPVGPDLPGPLRVEHTPVAPVPAGGDQACVAACYIEFYEMFGTAIAGCASMVWRWSADWQSLRRTLAARLRPLKPQAKGARLDGEPLYIPVAPVQLRMGNLHPKDSGGPHPPVHRAPESIPS